MNLKTHILQYKKEIDSIANAVLDLAIRLNDEPMNKFQNINSAIISVKGDIRYALEPYMAEHKGDK